MSTKSIIFVTLLIAFGLAACSDKAKVENPKSDFMDKLGITINDELLLKDSLNLPDIYCGDLKQQDADLTGKRLDHDQYMALVAPAGDNFKDEMGNWMLLGVRDVGNGVTLAAYYDCNGMGYCVELITYDKNGHLLDAINARELHLIWRCDMSNPKDTQSFTLDSFFTFEGSDSVTLHRVMDQCLMDYENDQPFTKHTTNPVPFIVVSDRVKSVKDGALCDIAPTLLTLAGVEIPAEMTGKNLVEL